MNGVYSIIIAGGSGTRFWPLSRQRLPKQFLPLASKHPLIQETVGRLAGISDRQRIFIVCGRAHARTVYRLLPRIQKKNVLVEPIARNTAPAIALAALHVSARDPSGVLIVLPADHHVSDVPSFRRCLKTAAELAQRGHLVTLGIKPTRPETGYGYIWVGERIGPKAHRVRAFVEKPNIATARKFLRSGHYLWNSGIFAFRADVLWRTLARHLPQVERLMAPLAAVLGRKAFGRELARAFGKLPAVSIDYGVMEKATNLTVVDGDFGWSDLGSFAAMSDVRRRDAQGNIVIGGKAVVLDCQHCVVVSRERLLAVVGVSDAVVVDGGDAVLVIPKSRSQDVRRVFGAVSARGWPQYL